MIQIGYKKRKESMESRADFLSDYWDKETNFLIQYYVQKKLKKSRMVMKKLSNIDPAVKSFMCRAYVFKCFLNFNIKFSVWRIKLHEG